MTKPTALYRFWDEDDELLYVGITQRIEARISAHRKTKPWDQVATITIEHHMTRRSAERAERRAIKTEHPRWNVTHSTVVALPPDPCVCHKCGRRIADRRTHYVRRGKTWCLRCAERALLWDGVTASCAAARNMLAGQGAE